MAGHIGPAGDAPNIRKFFGGNIDFSQLFAHRIAAGHEIDIRTIEAGEQQIVDGPVKILARAKHARDLMNFDCF